MAPEAKGGEGDSIGSETSEWLAVPGTERRDESSPEPEPPEQEAPDQVQQPESSSAELEDAEWEIERQQDEIKQMRSRIQQLERELSQSRQPRSPTKATPRPVRAAEPTGPLDLNAASYDDLRATGLSVADSARLTAYRDVHDGIGSVEELAEIPGLSEEAIEGIRGRVSS